MITKFDKKLQAEYDSITWELCVKRQGFLQSKQIVTQAEMIPLKLTRSVTLRYISQFWIKDADLYDDRDAPIFLKEIEKAFKEDKTCPTKLIKEMDARSKKCHLFIGQLQRNWKTATKSEKLSAFKKYVELLQSVQQFYIISLPLANYCEKQLQSNSPELLNLAVPHKSLELDQLTESLRKISSRPSNEQSKLIQDHLKKFAWIKTAYNIIEPYTKKDVREELKHLSPKIDSKKSRTPSNHYLVGLQIAIYLRNHLKELVQQLWFNIDRLTDQLALDFNIPRDEFFQLRHEEVVESILKGKLMVSHKTLRDRKKSHMYGYLRGKEVLLTGPIVDKFYAQMEKNTEKKTSDIKGQVAFRGLVRGKVKIILEHSEFSKLKKGEILVTNMTTPDFIVILKKAAAIVTNEGGLSCHAAIVSREFEIPCIIGTRNATKVLKDGDMVEVDAHHGIVRKI